jgi:hypothetical protein
MIGATLKRFLLFALPLLLLTMALYAFALETMGIGPRPPVAGVRELPGWAVLATWALESLGLVALFVLVHGRGGWRWSSGLLTGWIAWVFRGPLLVMTVVGLAGLAPGPWWAMAFSWWILYSICGLLLGGIAALSGYPS